ncbi:MAG: hypothetical protein J6Y57_06640, partial [Lachnospiraceae bacterium]|nr:hypothetical protein [Lachnospiraceae bacterium]
MKKSKKNGGMAALITVGILAGLTAACAFLYIMHGDRLTSFTRKETSLDHVPGDFQAASPEEILVESLLEPEVEIRIAEGTDSDGRRVGEDEILRYREEILAGDLNRYCYDHLDSQEQELYAEVYGLLRSFAKDTVLSTTDPDALKKVFSCVMLDHPEIFYVTGYSLTKYTRNNVIEDIAFSGKYTMTEEQARDAQQQVDAVSSACIAGFSGQDEYEKVKYVYEWLIHRCDYVLGAENNQNILSVFLTTDTVCQGYAKAAQYLLNKMGVFCILCEGEAMGREAHVWNIVRIDGEYYYLDVTWGDASYTFNETDSDVLTPPEINYEYMCVPYTEIAGTHLIQETVTLPVCNSMRDNYYVREGVYFTEVDNERLGSIFSDAYDRVSRTVYVKCADASVFEDMERYLIDEEHIFDYLRGNSKVNYIKMEERNLFLFYLN